MYAASPTDTAGLLPICCKNFSLSIFFLFQRKLLFSACQVAAIATLSHPCMVRFLIGKLIDKSAIFAI
jgi:hypothetical protein